MELRLSSIDSPILVFLSRLSSLDTMPASHLDLHSRYPAVIRVSLTWHHGSSPTTTATNGFEFFLRPLVSLTPYVLSRRSSVFRPISYTILNSHTLINRSYLHTSFTSFKILPILTIEYRLRCISNKIRITDYSIDGIVHTQNNVIHII